MNPRSPLRGLLKVCAACAFVVIPLGGFVVYTQEWQIFPAALHTRDWTKGKRVNPPPAGIESRFVTTPDGTRLEVWRRAPESPLLPGRSPSVAIFFHGNGETVDHSAGILEWLNSKGVIAYAFGFRGFGHSSGEPTEAGIYEDCDTILRYVIEREGVTPHDLLLVGRSLGTGPAAYSAMKSGAGTVVLISPYVILDDVVRQSPFFRLLVPFLRVHFPLLEYLKKAQGSKVVVMHGTLDNVISVKHSRRIAAELSRREGFHYIEIEGADHNSIFWSYRDRIEKALGWTSSDPDRVG